MCHKINEMASENLQGCRGIDFVMPLRSVIASSENRRALALAAGEGEQERTPTTKRPPTSDARARAERARVTSRPRGLFFFVTPPPKPLLLLLKAGRTSVAAKTNFRMVSRASSPRAALLLLWAAMAGLLLLSRAAALTVNAVQPSATEQLKEDNPGVTLNTTSVENDPVSQMLLPEVGQMEQSLYGRR